MGGCVSTTDHPGKECSDAIDMQIKSTERTKSDHKILLLGASDTGKSTIAKQMTVIFQGGFSDAELAEFRPVVYKNVLDSAQHVIRYAKEIGVECEEYSNRALANKLMDYKVQTHNCEQYFAPEIANAIHQVVRDPEMRKLIEEHSSEFDLMDSAQYFFREVLRIGRPGYCPNVADALRAQQKSVGITEMRFTMGQLSIHMFDVGGRRSERKKWMNCFESVTSIIFCTSLSEYDQVMLEEKSQNRMAESLVLFESIINSRWFLHTSIILILNKIDVFKQKLPNVPLERYFPEYTGGSDINKGAKYILWKFMQANRAQLTVYPHLAQATDTINIQLVFAAIKEMILQNALKDCGIL